MHLSSGTFCMPKCIICALHSLYACVQVLQVQHKCLLWKPGPTFSDTQWETLMSEHISIHVHHSMVCISGSNQKIWTQNPTVVDRVDRDIPIWLSGRADDWPSERHDSQDSPMWWGEDASLGMFYWYVKFIFPLGSSFSSFICILFLASSWILWVLFSNNVKTCGIFPESHISL